MPSSPDPGVNAGNQGSAAGRPTAMRRVLAVIVVAATALAGACGSGEESTLPLLPGSAAGAGAGGGAAESDEAPAMATDGAAGGVSADRAATSMIAPFEVVDYRLADSLPALGGDAPAYRLDAKIDADDVRRLARAVGVDAEPRQDGLSWTAGSPESGGQVYVGPDGSWSYYNEAIARVEAGVSSVAVCAPDGECKGETPASPPASAPTTVPADLPSEDEAIRSARELLEKVGEDVDGIKASTYRDAFSVGVQFRVEIDGVEVQGWERGVSFGDKGTLRNAFGSLARTVKLGDYPLLSAKAAFERAQRQQEELREQTLEAQREGAAADEELVDRVAPGADPDTAVSNDGGGSSGFGGSSGSAGAPEPAPGSEPVPEPVPAPQPEKIEVTLDEAELVLVVEHPMCPGDDVFLVPAYRYTSEQGEQYTYGAVPAVEDEYLLSSQGGEGAVKGGDVRVACETDGATDLPAKEEPNVGATEPAPAPPEPPADRPITVQTTPGSAPPTSG